MGIEKKFGEGDIMDRDFKTDSDIYEDSPEDFVREEYLRNSKGRIIGIKYVTRKEWDERREESNQKFRKLLKPSYFERFKEFFGIKEY